MVPAFFFPYVALARGRESDRGFPSHFHGSRREPVEVRALRSYFANGSHALTIDVSCPFAIVSVAELRVLPPARSSIL